MHTVRLARHAMATRFEIVIHGEDATALRAAGEEALDEVERLEQQLSLYQPTSEVAHLNALAAHEWARVTPELFRLVRRAKELSQETGGAFDITVGPLLRCWGFIGGTGQRPEPADLKAARANVGMHHVELDGENFSIRFARHGVMLDLGAIGKGYAIERAAEILRDAAVTSALLHGGTSTVYALGCPPDAKSWLVAIESPRGIPDAKPALLALVSLKDEAMSVSAVWGKSFQTDGKTYGHVIDPRTGEPANQAALAAVVLPSATETDALSTALLTLGLPGLNDLERLRPGARTLVLEQTETAPGFRARARGIKLESGSA